MKTLKFKIMYLIVAFLATSMTAFPPELEELTKNFHREFVSDKNTKVIIENKYGDVKIENSETNSVVIDVKVVVDTKSEKKAKEYLDKINVEFYEKNNEIKAVTKIDGIFKKIEFSVDYTIKMPNNLALNINNKFGNIVVGDFNGKVDFDLEYGDLVAGKLNYNESEPMNEIKLSYSDGKVEKCNWAKINLKYSDFKLKEESRFLGIESRFSTIVIESNSSLVCDSRYDSYTIENCNNFLFTSEFSDATIGNLTTKAEISTKYGDINIRNVSPKFELIKIDDSFGDIKIGIDPSVSYQIDAETQFCEIELPTAKVTVVEKEFRNSYKGTVGTNSNPVAQVKIVSKYGDINLKK